MWKGRPKTSMGEVGGEAPNGMFLTIEGSSHPLGFFTAKNSSTSFVFTSNMVSFLNGSSLLWAE